MWGLVLLELIMFAALVLIVAWHRVQHPQEVQMASAHLQISDGLLYTGVLLLSGFFAAEGVRYFYELQRRRSLISFSLAAVLGMSFLVLKWQDFAMKSQMGLHIETNDFWQYYWLIMSFHFLHVLVGEAILIAIIVGIHRGRHSDPEFSIRGGTLFWHMCDLAWLIIFPSYYLIGHMK